ncbi:putative transcription elongation factor SPT5 homolog 1 [Tanacetum coccineum]|uniref:Transcription elongation factor SPT5 homolog 1 n=1 Tax=Tanacetum coccineum TaxID=301880 RepID=A0ABQ4YSD2_9ASTR
MGKIGLPMDSIPSPSRAIFPADSLSRRAYGDGFTRAIPMADGADFENGGGSEGGTSRNTPSSDGEDGRYADKLVVVGNHFFKITVGDLLRAYFVTLGSGKSVYKCVVESKLLVSTLKNLLSVTLSVPEFRDRINRLEGMDHPHLLPIRAYCYDEYDKFILYDYAPSGSLFDLLYADRRPLTIGDRLTIALGVAGGINYLHTHAISHGNIKSSNIIVTTGLHVFVLALGLPSTSHRFTAYRAPEVTDPYNVSQEADVYSFGVLILELLTKKNPNCHILYKSQIIDLVGWVKLKVEEFGNSGFLEVRPENDVEQRQIKQLLILAANCFIVDERDEQEDVEDARRMRLRLPTREDEQEDVEALEREIQERYGRNQSEYDDDYEDDDQTEVEQQALLPCVRDPKLWMVKCAIGHEREATVCLMQKCITKPAEMQIRSAIALDHLKNYIYIEAYKEAHVRELYDSFARRARVCVIYLTHSKILLVPIKEMTDVLSVESKSIDISRDNWVRMKIGIYKGDLAKVVDVDNVRQRVTVKLIPRIDLQALANKLEGREVQKKKIFTPPLRFMNVDEARDMHIRVERRRDPMTGDYFENINGMMFKDGFLYKTVSIKSIRIQNIQPSFDELEKFRQPNEDGDGDIANLSTLFANRKKGHFMKGDRVIIIKGDLKNLKGWVEKVEENTIHIKPNATDLPETLAVNERELCKYFEPGNHVKVVSGAQEGVTGMVISVEGHLVNIVSDTTKEALRVFSDNVVESSEVTSDITKIGDFELHDLVQLDEAIQVLKGVADRAEVQLVRLRDIKYKIDRKLSAQDRYKNTVSTKDVVKVIDGPCKASSTGRQGPVEHIYRGILVIYDRHHPEHAGFICTRSQSCILVGDSRANGVRNNLLASRVSELSTPPRFSNSPGRSLGRGVPPLSGGRHRGGGRGGESLAGRSIKIRLGPWKGYKGRVVDASGTTVRIELESQMKVVTDDRTHISGIVNAPTTLISVYSDTIYAFFSAILYN